MNTALSWIKAYVPALSCTPQEYTDAMTLSGTKVEGYERLDKNLEKIVVGQIIKIEKHPDADKLIVCQVNVGEETVQIVTGAPNVKEGDKVPVVLDGGRVAGGHDGGPLPENGIRIKKGKLRGIESCGMMCSIEELGSSRDMYPDAPEEGIYILPSDTPVGADAVEVLGLHDSVFEYEITSNRVDCYSVLGIAREAAATFDKPFCAPEVSCEGNEEDVSEYAQVEVKDPDLCSRYCARVVKNIKIGPSPQWMQRRLAASGIRPINNLVDITNYVMEEYGQPMHAFDLDTIAGHKIIVRRAADGDRFQTLDGQMRTLDSDILMICDAEKEIGIAGIMGGENSKITDDVHTVLFEAACFNGTNIRLSAKRLGLRTDASGKFEKGLDPNNASLAINRACQLVEELGCGEAVGGMLDVYPVKREEKRVAFDPEGINRLLGTRIAAEDMLRYFEKLELRYDEAAGELIIPTFRQDLECKADIAEEVARFFGYANIPTTLPSGKAMAGKLSFKLRVEEITRNVARFCGFSQAMTYSFESPKVFDRLLLPEDSPLRRAVRIQNPLGEDYSIMRTTPLNGLLTSLATNYNRRNKDVRLFELANIYLPGELPLTELPDERMQLTLGFYGEGDFFAMKGVVEELFDQLGLHKKTGYDPAAAKPYLHPGRQADIRYEGRILGYLGEMHPQVADYYGIGERTYIAVIDMPQLVELACFDHKYEGLARFPAVTRDISMVVRREVLVGQIEEVVEKKGGKLLESCRLFDVYEGAQILSGYKSVAYSITFRGADRTLEDKEVNAVMDKIVGALKELGAQLRA
ncbi:MAG: phenylalanine--tRNA ligase subunit beta [Lachnospiraceae bacterium]|jgi:phenylalanyl-tRNA synthetase beta chain|nr:phenylalanine--tRNA ligase subunit beta [Lachnospiraceae bacterium]